MIFFGVGELFGGQIMGFVVDKFGSKVTTLKNVFLAMLMTAVTFTSVDMCEYNYMTFIMCFVWGYLDGANNIHIF